MKITFVTFHNWETKRIGGFHKFAEAFADGGHEVVFFSCARPYFIYFKDEERLNKNVLRKLSKGVICKTEKGNPIVNCTWPTLRIPQPLYRKMPRFINRWFSTHSIGFFSSFQEQFLKGTDVFVFESCDCVDLFDKIRQYNPKAKFVYRPSDPLVASKEEEVCLAEWNVLTKSNKTLIVNNEGLYLYQSVFPEFDKYVNYTILSNGVDVEKFGKTYPKPEILKKNNTALYVGAREAQWDLILYSANKCPNINFVIVCPETPPSEFVNSNLSNLTYVPGIPPSEVPAWITNCDIVIIPNPKGRWKVKPWGITAKYYQAMKANKPIVAYEDTPRLKSEFNIDVAYSEEEFVGYINKNFSNIGRREYYLEGKNWGDITKQFISEICNL